MNICMFIRVHHVCMQLVRVWAPAIILIASADVTPSVCICERLRAEVR